MHSYLQTRYFTGFVEQRVVALFMSWSITIAAEGGKADVAKPMHGLGSGVFEIALPFKGDAFRVVYAVKLGDEIWVVHAFRKKSTQGIRTPPREIGVAKGRLKRLKEILR